MDDNNKRRSFLKNIAIGSVGAAVAPTSLLQAKESEQIEAGEKKDESANNSGKTSQKRK